MRLTTGTRARSLIAALAIAAGALAGGSAAEAAPARICPDGSFCIELGGVWRVYPECTTVPINDAGSAPFDNNKDTPARAYGASGSVVWSVPGRTAGTVDLTPVWYLRTC